MSQQKLLLDVSAMVEDFFAETSLIGIVCTHPAYRLAWLLNTKFNLDFVRETESDIQKNDVDKKEHFFIVYKQINPTIGIDFTLYKLRSEKETLLPEVKQLDYIWMIQNYNHEEQAQQYIQHLKTIDEIQLAQQLDPDKLKNIINLVI